MRDDITAPIVIRVKKMLAEDLTIQQISKIEQITVACLERNKKVWDETPEENKEKLKNRERGLKAAKTRALNNQAKKLLEEAADSEVEEQSI